MAVSPPINDARFPAEAMKSQHAPCWRSPYLRFIGMRPPFFPVLYPLFIKGWLLILMCSLWGRFLFIHVTVNPPCSKAKTAFIQAYSGASSYGLRCPASDGRSDTARWFDENRGILHRDRWSFHRLEDENRLWLIQYTWSRVFSLSRKKHNLYSVYFRNTSPVPG